VRKKKKTGRKKLIVIYLEGISEMILDFEKNNDQEYATFGHK